MSRAYVTLNTDETRKRAAHWAMTAPIGTRLVFSEPKRSEPQNAKLWVCLTQIARQVSWGGVKLSADDWKLVFMDALNSELRMVPNIAGNGFVNLGRSSSNLSKGEFSDLLELVHKFAAEHDVDLGD